MSFEEVKEESNTYLQKIINADFNMGSINTEDRLLKDKNFKKFEDDENIETEESKRYESKSENLESESPEDVFQDVKFIDSGNVTPTNVPKSPGIGRNTNIKTNGSLSSAHSPQIKADENTTAEFQFNKEEPPETDLQPKRKNMVKLERRFSELEGIDRKAYMIENQYKGISGTTSLERNINLRSNQENDLGDQRRLSGWLTLGRSFQSKHTEEYNRTKRTTWGGKYARKQQESLKVLNELENAYEYSSDSLDEQSYNVTVEDRGNTSIAEAPLNEAIRNHDESGDVFITPNNEDDMDDERVNDKVIREYLSISMSGIYGILLVVTGAVLPLAETFADSSLPYVFEAFYVYLYVISLLFLIYVYIFMMRKRQLRMRDIAHSLSRKLSVSKTSSTSTPERKEKGKILSSHYITDPSCHTGSFYLRLGAVVFGVGSMIHSGLHVGQRFQVFDGPAVCNRPIQAAKPLCHLIFTFVQLYFIFLNSKMCVNNYKTIARFGMMHMCGTNICVWFRSLVVETLSVIHQWERIQYFKQTTDQTMQQTNDSDPWNDPKVVTEKTVKRNITTYRSLPELSCYWDNMMGRVVESTGPYLYPCTIEYSLICAGVLYVMWTNVGKGLGNRQRSETVSDKNDGSTQADDELNSSERKRHLMSVDCANSSRGLFSGILVSVGAIITMIAFYVMLSQSSFKETAVNMVHLSEITMYLLTTIACILAADRMHKLRHCSTLKFGLEENLILISFTGLAMFGLFSIIPDIYYTHKPQGVLNVLTNFLMILQAWIQTVVILAARRVRATNKKQEREKPGREFITFLILCNFAMWIMNTFQTQQPEHNPIQLQFYGPMAWAIFTHVSVPLGIFFRFHSSVYLSSIWKSTWKIKKKTSE